MRCLNSFTVGAGSAVLGVVGLLAAPASAITDANSANQVIFNDASTSAVSQWLFNGQNQVSSFDYFIQINGQRQSLGSLNYVGTLGGGAGQDFRLTRYTVGDLTIDLRYGNLTGTTLTSTLPVTISVLLSPNASAPVSFSIFEYNDFDLDGTAGGDNMQVFNGNDVVQTGGNVLYRTSSTKDGSGLPDYFAADQFANVGALIAGTSNLPLDPLVSTNVAVAGDTEFAFQWDFTLDNDITTNPVNTATIAIIKQLSINTAIPEPATTALIGMSLAALGTVVLGRRNRTSV
jgi:hypothetical protein